METTDKNRRLSTSLTDSRFTGWGWSMIIYALLMNFFFAFLSTDVQNLVPTLFSEVYSMDSTTLLAYATPASIVGIVGGFVFARLLIKYNVRTVNSIALIITGIALPFGLIVGISHYMSFFS